MALNYIPYRLPDLPPRKDWGEIYLTIIIFLAGFGPPILLVLLHLMYKWRWL